MGKPKHDAEIKDVYEELFRNPNGIKGLALGISGDRVSKIYGKMCRMSFVVY